MIKTKKISKICSTSSVLRSQDLALRTHSQTYISICTHSFCCSIKEAWFWSSKIEYFYKVFSTVLLWLCETESTPMAVALYWIQKWWRGWGMRRDRPGGVGHVVCQYRAGCSCSLRKTEKQKSLSGLYKPSTQGTGILTRLPGFSVIWYHYLFVYLLNHGFPAFRCWFWCDPIFWPILFTRENQLNNSNLVKVISTCKLFLWSFLKYRLCEMDSLSASSL